MDDDEMSDHDLDLIDGMLAVIRRYATAILAHTEPQLYDLAGLAHACLLQRWSWDDIDRTVTQGETPTRWHMNLWHLGPEAESRLKLGGEKPFMELADLRVALGHFSVSLTDAFEELATQTLAYLKRFPANNDPQLGYLIGEYAVFDYKKRILRPAALTAGGMADVMAQALEHINRERPYAHNKTDTALELGQYVANICGGMRIGLEYLQIERAKAFA